MTRAHRDRYSQMALKRRLREARLRLRLNQTEVAARIYETQGNISHIEIGRTDITVGRAVRLAEAYGTHPLELIADFPPEVCALADILADFDPRLRSAVVDLVLRHLALMELVPPAVQKISA